MIKTLRTLVLRQLQHVRYVLTLASIDGAVQRLGAISWHYIGCGAFFGIGTRLSPDRRTHTWAAWRVLLGLVFLAVVTDGTAQLGLVMLLVSPVWTYAAVKINDLVMENRAYLSVFGVAILLATLAQDGHPVLASMVVLAWGVRTFYRLQDYRTGLAYWTKARQESPNFPRAIVNYAEHVSRKGQRTGSKALIDQACWEYEYVLRHFPESKSAALAAANLSMLLVDRWVEAERNGDLETKEASMLRGSTILDDAVDRFPNEFLVRNARGVYFMALKLFNDALYEFSEGVRLAPRNPTILRNRGRCYAWLNETKLSKADYRAAEALDGRAGQLIDLAQVVGARR